MPGMVTVACKMPNGLKIRLYNYQTQQIQVMGGGIRDIEVPVPKSDWVKLNGSINPAAGIIPDYQLSSGYGLTQVDADFWTAWHATNKETDLVKNRVVFAHDKTDAVNKIAKDYGDARSGLEPLNPETKIKDGKEVHVDPRFLKGVASANKTVDT